MGTAAKLGRHRGSRARTGALLAACLAITTSALTIAAPTQHADATPPNATTGLLNFLGNTTVGQGAALGPVSCPAPPPEDCQSQVAPNNQYAPAPVAGQWWVMPGDSLTVTAGFVGCYPTGPTNAKYSWKPVGFSNPAQADGDVVASWRFGGAPLTAGVTTPESSKTTIPTTTTVLLSNLTAADDGKNLTSVGPQSTYEDTCNRRPREFTVNGTGASYPVRVFNPQATLTKEVCTAFDSDGSTCMKWGKGPAAYVFGQTVMWRITVANTGNVDIADVKIENDDLSSSQFPALNGTGLCQGASAVNLGDPSLGSTILAPGNGATNTDKAVVTCSTDLPAAPVGGVASGTVTNTAQAIGNPVDPSGDGSISARFKDGTIEYRTEPDNASAQIENPHLTLKKEVCTATDSSGACADWQDADTDTASPGYGLPMVAANTPTHPSPVAKPSQWRITVTNDGSVDLTGLTLKSDQLTHGADASMSLSSCLNEPFPNGGALAHTAGQNKVSITCTGPDVTDPFAPLVNTAQATATYETTLVDSNTNDAQVIARKAPALSVKKYACTSPDPTTCVAPTDLSTLGTSTLWKDTGAEPGSTDRSSRDRVHVPDGGTITWLVVATNDGNMPLGPITIGTDTVTGGSKTATGCEAGKPVPAPAGAKNGLLWPQPAAGADAEVGEPYQAAITCTSGPIAGSVSNNTVNAVQLEATATDPGGTPDTTVTVPTSNTDVARGIALTTGLQLKKYACQNPFDGTGVGCPPPWGISAATPEELTTEMEAFGWMDTDDPGVHVFLQDGSDVTWLAVAHNTGTSELADVRVSKDELGLVGGTPAAVADCEKPMTVLNGGDLLPPDGYAISTCTTGPVAAFNPGVETVNTAQATGKAANPDPATPGTVELLDWPADTATVTSNTDVARAQAYSPHLALTKQVCKKGTGCDVKDNDDWIPSVLVAQGTGAQWRLTVTNDGDVPMDNVQIQSDTVTSGAAGKAPTPAGCSATTQFGNGDVLTPGDSFSLTCTSDEVTDTTQATVNTAIAAGQPLDPDDTDKKLPSYVDELFVTNPATAQATAVDAKIEVKKYACATGTGCTVPAVPFTVSDLNTDQWLDTENGSTPSHVLIADGGTIQWLIVATNTGDTSLTDVKLAADDLSGQADGVSNSCKVGTAFDLPDVDGVEVLDIDASTAMDCTSGPIKATSPLADTINTAQVSSNPVLADGTPVPGYNEPITSGTDIAKVAATKPGLTLTKYACQNPDPTRPGGTGCEIPTGPAVSAADLKAAGWMDTDAEGDHVIVKASDPVEWLIVLENTGNVPLSDVQVSKDEVTTGVDPDRTTVNGPTACTGETSLLDAGSSLLEPGGFAIKTCATDKVDATTPTSEVVNAATAIGMPMNPDDATHMLNGADTTTVESNTDTARAQAASPALALSKWVCAAGQSCEMHDFTSDQAPGPWVRSTDVPAGTNVSWLIVVTNTGNVSLTDVRLTGESLTADGAPARPGDGSTCATRFGDHDLAPGEFAEVECTSTDVGLAESPLVNRATATGTDFLATAVRSPSDRAVVTVASPAPVGPDSPGGGGNTPAHLALPLTGATSLWVGIAALTLIGCGTLARRLRRNRPATLHEHDA